MHIILGRIILATDVFLYIFDATLMFLVEVALDVIYPSEIIPAKGG